METYLFQDLQHSELKQETPDSTAPVKGIDIGA